MGDAYRMQRFQRLSDRTQHEIQQLHLPPGAHISGDRRTGWGGADDKIPGRARIRGTDAVSNRAKHPVELGCQDLQSEHAGWQMALNLHRHQARTANNRKRRQPAAGARHGPR